jgi:hypothetical protein
MICRIQTNEELPVKWKSVVICSIHKKGNKEDCNNYRGIVLLNVIYKVLLNCILSKLKGKAEEILANYQRGFRPGKSTIDQIFIRSDIHPRTVIPKSMGV